MIKTDGNKTVKDDGDNKTYETVKILFLSKKLHYIIKLFKFFQRFL